MADVVAMRTGYPNPECKTGKGSRWKILKYPKQRHCLASGNPIEIESANEVKRAKVFTAHFWFLRRCDQRRRSLSMRLMGQGYSNELTKLAFKETNANYISIIASSTQEGLPSHCLLQFISKAGITRDDRCVTCRREYFFCRAKTICFGDANGEAR